MKFKNYLAKLVDLDIEQSLLQQKGKRVMILTGSSHFKHCELSDIQKTFLKNEIWADYQTITTNFPYNRGFRTSHPSFPNIVQASWSNIVYYWQCLFNKKFAQEIARHLRPLKNNQETIVIAQSSGLKMLLIAWPQIEKTDHLRVIALGPVTFMKNRDQKINLQVIKGRQDKISKFLDSHKVNKYVDCQHFDYLQNEEVRNYINDVIKN